MLTMLLQLVSNKLKPILVAQRQRSWSDIYGYLESLSPPALHLCERQYCTMRF